MWGSHFAPSVQPCTGLLKEFMGPRANYKCGALADFILWFCWYVGLEDLPQKILKIRPSDHEIEFESNFSSISQHSRSSTFLIVTLWDWMWGWFQQFITIIHYTLLITGKFWELDPLRLNFRVISASLYLMAIRYIFLITGKFWELDHWNWIGNHFSDNHSICYSGTLWLQEIFEN